MSARDHKRGVLGAVGGTDTDGSFAGSDEDESDHFEAAHMFDSGRHRLGQFRNKFYRLE